MGAEEKQLNRRLHQASGRRVASRLAASGHLAPGQPLPSLAVGLTLHLYHSLSFSPDILLLGGGVRGGGGVDGRRRPRISRPTPSAHFDSPCFPTMASHDMHLSSLLPCHFLSPTPSPRKKTQTDMHRERCIERTIKLACSRPGRFHPTSFFIFPRLSRCYRVDCNFIDYAVI